MLLFFYGSAIINMLKPVTVKKIEECALNVFIPHKHRYLEKSHIVDIVDIVWDQYLENSIKSQVREKRGKGIKRRVKASTTLPRNWQQFLRVADNKKELCAFLNKYIAQVQTASEIVSTDGYLVVCVPPPNTTNLAP